MGTTITFILGLDFGTSMTKVVINEHYEREIAYPVKFNEQGLNLKYLLPSKIFLDDNRKFSLTASSNSRQISDLKYQLIQTLNNNADKPVKLQSNAVINSIAYLSLVIKYAKSWFKTNYSKHFGTNREWLWEYNLGIPSKGYDDDEQKELYRKIFFLAVELSENNNEINKQNIVNLIGLDNNDVEDHINVVPEVIAEVSSYKSSSKKQLGLHFLIDIGATTIDVTSFIITEDEDKIVNYKILYTDVQPKGTLEINKDRQRKLFFSQLSWYYEQMNYMNEMENVPESYSDFLPKTDYFKDSFTEIDNRLKEDISKIIRKMICEVKKYRDPNSEYWRKGLPLFLCGGGSYANYYQDLVNSVSIVLRQQLNPYNGFIQHTLVKPNWLKDPNNEVDFIRMAVATGLSTPYDEIGDMKPAHLIEDVQQIKSDKYDNVPEYYDRDKI